MQGGDDELAPRGERFATPSTPASDTLLKLGLLQGQLRAPSQESHTLVISDALKCGEEGAVSR